MTAQLVRADNGYHLWSETYDRELRDVFKVQDDIANAVVQALQIKLAGGELSRRKGGTQNLEAYQLYLRALSCLTRTPSRPWTLQAIIWTKRSNSTRAMEWRGRCWRSTPC